ncbi:MAG TPA: sigma-70 family RNA polymerase sigma factor [Terriglobales bacterium]|jgi:RNA polymerase sigma factor (sigma-70 family)
MTPGSHAQPETPPREASPIARLEGFGPLISELYDRSGATAFGISLAEFTLILGNVVNTQADSEAGDADIRNLITSLRIEELVLARACAAGNERAWDVFLTRHREGLYTAAMGIARDDPIAHEMADSLYADLFGTEAPGGIRISKLNSYMGIGSLQGWLRTILAHTFIDRYRTERPLVSLTGEDEDEDFDLPAPPPAAIDAVDPRLESATDEALRSLTDEDRYLLASWFLHGRTMAELGRTLGVHESTISRRVDKLTGALRKKISAGLIRRGMTRRQAEEALDIDVRDVQVNVRQRLEESLQDRRGRPSISQETETGGTNPNATDEKTG